MTHRDGLSRFSARSVRCGDAGHREAGATLPGSLERPPRWSRMQSVGGRRNGFTMPRIDCARPSYPTDRLRDL